jgi:hypothetical protein
MATNERWTGWIGFAGLLLVIIAFLDFFEGLIAIIRGEYYLLTPNQIVVFDLKTWGWLTLIWAVIIGLTGFGLISGATWARWTAIVLISINILTQLGFVGAAQYPLWALTVMFLNIIVLYALTVHWSDTRAPAYGSSSA